KSGELAALQARVLLGSRPRLEVRRVLHQGTDHVALPPLGYLAPQVLIGMDALARPEEDRANGLPARRQALDPTEIQMAIHRERQRSRDGRSRHHQEMGLPCGWSCGLTTFVAKGHTLPNAEPVLLVGNRQQQFAELDSFLDHCLCADYDVHVARRD